MVAPRPRSGRLRICDVQQSDAPPGRAVAVIGSGVAGLTAAYILSGRDRVTLYEADDRLGGHAHTHFLDAGSGPVGVDSAFLVHNDRTYPTLCRLFDELGVATQESDMSMSVRADDIGLEYAGARGVPGLFACRQALRPRYLGMLAEVLRFQRTATRLLRDEAADQLETLETFLNRHGFSAYFVDYFITPLVAAVWSCAGQDALRYPARYLFVFLSHHGMLTVFGSPTWRTVTGGSATYVQAIASRLDEVSTRTPVHSLRRLPGGGVMVHAGSNAPRFFDAAVVAVHPDQALLLLDEPTPPERAVLGAIPYSTNRAQLHTDESVLPRHPRARASWNYLVTPGNGPVVVSYDVSRLMRIDGNRRFLVTLGGHDRVDPGSVLAEMTYSHPLYTPESVGVQALLPRLDDDSVVFAGAYHGWGFHEDGAASGLRAARRLGADWPTTPSPTPRSEVVTC